MSFKGMAILSRPTIEVPHRVLHQGPGKHQVCPTRPVIVMQADQLQTRIDLIEEDICLEKLGSPYIENSADAAGDPLDERL